MLPSDGDNPDDGIEVAYRANDAAALMRHYVAEADRLEGLGQTDAACFFLTHAYVWALEAGLPEARGLHSRLRAAGREL